jgi:magnesium transporter
VPLSGDDFSAQVQCVAMIVDVAIYVNGRRNASCPLEGVYDACREGGGFAWVGLHEPSEEEFVSVTGEFDLHRLAVEDAIKAHQRPKVERYGDSIFVVLRSARYLESSRTLEFGEIHAFVGPDYVVTVRHGEASSLRGVRQKVEDTPELLRRGPAAVLYVIMDHVVDDYASVIDSLENDIDEVETEVFGGNPGVSRRIYEISREVIQFYRATQPLAVALEHLMDGNLYEVELEVREHLRDVEDHLLRATERIEAFRELLSSIVIINLTLVSVNQNEEVKALTQASIEQNDQVKRISAWAAILAVPTIFTSIYGMNFTYMPELTWKAGYPLLLVLIVLITTLLYRSLKGAGWL